MMMLTGLLSAQIHITGTVYSKGSKETLPGVSVMVKGTTLGTVTDLNGNFSLSAPPKSVLRFSYVGYKTEEIPVNGKTNLKIFLQESSKQLGEVVVVGYGVQKKSDVTGSLVSLSSKDIAESHQQSLSNVIQGRAAGVNVIENSGAPGRPAEINIRGVGSINGAPPLWIVDGVPTSGDINPNDIASIEILKDASATAIYGTKGANGVILVTTKSGKGKMEVTYQNRLGWGSLYRELPLTDADQWARLKTEAYQNAGLPVPPNLKGPFGKGTDWQKAVTRTAFSNNQYLSFNGGTKKLSYFISANYNKQEGIVQKSDNTLSAFRVNLSSKINKWLRVGENLSISSTKTHYINEDDEWNAIMIEAISIDPITPVKNPDGSWGGSKFNTVNNPVAHLDRTKGKEMLFSVGGNAFFEITFLKDFKWVTRLGYEHDFDNFYNWQPTYFVKTGEENSQTSVSRDYAETTDWVVSNFLTWNHHFGKHNVKVMAGSEVEENSSHWFGVTATDLISESAHLIYIDNASGNQDASSYGSASDIRYQSLFGRVNYAYADKYLLTVNYRYQGSSMFGPAYRYGGFPSASLGWKISKENFMRNIKWLNNLKLRLGYGISGNDLSLRPYAYYSVAQTGQRYVIGNKIVDGVSFPRIANPELHWEQKASFNTGLDAAFLNDRLTLTFDYYLDKTNQMLYDPDLPGHVGTQEMPFTNVASLQNKGFEFTVGYKQKIKDFKFNVSLNVSHVKNLVTSLGSADYIAAAPFMQMGYISRTEVGHPMASFYGYICDGLFQTQADVDAYVKPDGTPIQPNAAPGDIRYKADENGNLILGFIGSPFPKFTSGLNINMSYKNFSLLVFFYGVYGNKIFNATKFYNNNSSVRYNENEDMMNRWMKAGDTDDPNLARLNLNDANNSLRSDRFVEDGSYLRLKNAQLSYQLPKRWLSKIQIKSLSVFVGGDNLFTLTKYSGFDPEVGLGYGNNPLDRGIDRARYPSPRVVYTGLNLNF
jgi:TonB-linked SusC/RagA family outer membrane protein